VVGGDAGGARAGGELLAGAGGGVDKDFAVVGARAGGVAVGGGGGVAPLTTTRRASRLTC